MNEHKPKTPDEVIEEEKLGVEESATPPPKPQSSEEAEADRKTFTITPDNPPKKPDEVIDEEGLGVK